MKTTLTTKLATAAAATGLALAAVVGAATPATAAPTAATFEIIGGNLSVAVPATADLGTVASGAGLSARPLGAVTVTDARGALAAAWTASVTSTEFSAGTATNQKVANTNIAYSSGAATPTGTGAFTPSVALSMGTPGTGAAWAGTGNNSAAWTPTLTFTLLGSQVAGVYTGTVTHSVA